MHSVRPQLEALTGLRFLAAAAVVVYHFGRPSIGSAVLRDFFSNGYVGVDLFFVLSGFVLVYVYRPWTGLDVRGFLAARFARVFPLYFVSLLIGAPFFFQDLVTRNGAVAASWKGCLSTVLHLTMTHAWVAHVGVWNVPDWSLSCEWAFYITFPLLVPRVLRARHALIAATVLFTAGLILPIAIDATVPRDRIHSGLVSVVMYHPLLRVHEFLLGALLAKAWLDVARLRETRLARWLAPAGGLVAVAVLALGPRVPTLTLSNGLLVPAWGALIIGLATGGSLAGRVLATRPLVLLGEASYGVYILHWPVWECFARAREVFGGPRSGDGGWFWGYCVVLSVLSVAAQKWIEVPARGWLRERLAPVLISTRRSGSSG